MVFLGSLSHWNTILRQRPNLLADDFSVFLKNLEIILLHSCSYFLYSTRCNGRKTAPQHNTTTTMLDSRYGVLGVKRLTFSLPNIWLVTVAKQLNIFFFFEFHWTRIFLQGFSIVRVISSKLQLSFKLEEGLLYCMSYLFTHSDAKDA